ncbi:hypothetical protein HNY73_014723 [Argiope bruennichi]|uniref:Uncharacterized protein n=1 Tax=Argiope bruennichi TaxID=94029 RepID=A0A8T0EPX0_ARGBR|nr:hypothetical protein HNY73_014723 [Argiope bruennichi]
MLLFFDISELRFQKSIATTFTTEPQRKFPSFCPRSLCDLNFRKEFPCPLSSCHVLLRYFNVFPSLRPALLFTMMEVKDNCHLFSYARIVPQE